ncbi:hypothetical protein N9121_00125 [Pseudomonadales bacterium]|nr:hypothetical protein [Pseudomonadales bacterium]
MQYVRQLSASIPKRKAEEGNHGVSSPKNKLHEPQADHHWLHSRVPGDNFVSVSLHDQINIRSL